MISFAFNFSICINFNIIYCHIVMLSYLRKKTVDEDRIIVEKSVTATENKTCMTGRYIYQMCLVLHQKLLWSLMESCYCKLSEVHS